MNDGDFIESLGPAFLAHLLRRLSDALVEADKQWHAERNIDVHPRTSSTLLALDRRGSLAVTELARLLSQSHPLVIKWIKNLGDRGLVAVAPDPKDRRRSLVSLTAKGRTEAARLKDVIRAVDTATQRLIDETAPGLFEALWRMERLLRDRPFVERIRAAAA